jgi:glycine/D-amino acid oxidase-like deaminating enzyme
MLLPYFCLMQVDFLIIGQGISGTWLSYYLEKEGQSFLVIDNNDAKAPSKIAAGLINPVTGRRHVKVWMAEDILPFALDAYQQLGIELGIDAISQKNIVDFFPSPQMRISFVERVNEKAKYVSLNETENQYHPFFNYEFGYGKITPVYTAHVENILPAWRNHLEKNNRILQDDFTISELEINSNGISYKNIIAKKIIFCDGNSSVSNPYFKNLPFVPNKGEAITLEIPGLPAERIYKKGMTLAPLATPGHWWIGSSYQWEFSTALPTDDFYNKTKQLLNQWLKIPFTITGHYAAVRPATLQRRPFVGFHPLYSSIGILNGMGTKGCSLAPYFAKQLVDNILHQKPITPEADIKRYSKILSK